MSEIEDNPVAKGLSGLESLISRAGGKGKGLPPVDKWNPDFCGDLDMVIKADGTWFYMGTPIGRHALVKLFSSVLRKDEDGKTYLITPVEKVGITVEDAHFIIVEMNAHEKAGEQVITFRTNMDDVFEAGPDNPLRFVTVKSNEGVKPYVLVRGRLEGVLARSVMYELIAHGEEVDVNGQLMFSIRSNGITFPIMPADELARRSAE
ncbi:MAG: DUF1285 domain-containing protein [Pseudomonadota bacterium]